MFLRFVTITFWNSYVLKLLRFKTIMFSDATLSDKNVVWCYVLSQYRPGGLHYYASITVQIIPSPPLSCS